MELRCHRFLRCRQQQPHFVIRQRSDPSYGAPIQPVEESHAFQRFHREWVTLLVEPLPKFCSLLTVLSVIAAVFQAPQIKGRIEHSSHLIAPTGRRVQSHKISPELRN
jgi:hypothetical protein